MYIPMTDGAIIATLILSGLTVSDQSTYSDLKQLGKFVEMPESPDKAVLESVPNPQPDVDYCVRFSAPEFTSLCPLTSQPDFAHLVIDYVPAKKLVESKSLKLYLSSFRNHGAFHEDCTVGIARRLIDELDPKWLRIGGYWYCLLYTSPSPRDKRQSRMPSSA